jgi:hypothetical protein
MANPRGSVSLGSGPLTLVVDVSSYQPFGELALGVRVFDGIEATTIQDFGFRADRQQGTLSSGGRESPGLVAAETLAALLALVTAWGVGQAFADSLGNAGTIKPIRFSHQFEYAVPGPQVSLHSYTLAWRWLTLTQLFGAPYTGR